MYLCPLSASQNSPYILRMAERNHIQRRTLRPAGSRQRVDRAASACVAHAPSQRNPNVSAEAERSMPKALPGGVMSIPRQGSTRMSSRTKLVREQMKLILGEFEAGGIKEWYVEATSRNHVKVTFYRGGKTFIFVLAPSSERHAKYNT